MFFGRDNLIAQLETLTQKRVGIACNMSRTQADRQKYADRGIRPKNRFPIHKD